MAIEYRAAESSVGLTQDPTDDPNLPPDIYVIGEGSGHDGQNTQNSSAGTGETNKLIIGLVVAIVIPVVLAMMGLAYFCVVRKRRRSNGEIAKVPKGR